MGAASISKAAEQAKDGGSTVDEMGFPVTMAPRHDGCEIIWAVNAGGKPLKGYIEYGETEKLGETMKNDGWGLRPSGDKVIKVRLEGLKPGTKYCYRTVTESYDTKKPEVKKSGVRTFTTLDPAAGKCKFSVWNDTHKHYDTVKKLEEMTTAGDFLFLNGDICNDWHTEEDIPETLLENGGIEMSAKHPLFFVRGNHDIRGAYAGKMEEYCAMPEDKPWYAFRQGPVAFICMDTGEDKPDDHPYLFGRVACEPMRKEQAEWLAKVIEQPEMKNAPYRVLFCHIPLRWTNETEKRSYDSHSKRSRDLWHDSLVKWKAQVVVSGHMHRTALIDPTDDFPYAQLVGGGPKMDSATVITGEADEKEFTLKCTKLDKSLAHELKLKPLT